MQRFGPLIRRMISPFREGFLRRRRESNLFRFGRDVKCAFSRNDYGVYCVPVSSSHRPASRRILENRVYEPRTIEFMRNACGSGDVIHAGTFFGDFLPALSGALHTNATLWAFEPNPESYRCAEITAYINDLRNVRLANVAVGAETGLSALLVEDPNGLSLGGASRIIAQRKLTDERGKLEIHVSAIDQIVPPDRQVSIIQLDVEGYEIEALKGAVKTIARCRPILVLEAIGNYEYEDDSWFCENILALGYCKVAKLHGNVAYRANSLVGG